MKQILIITSILCLLALDSNAQKNDKCFKIKVKIEGLSTNEGKLMIALYNSESSFLNQPYKVCAASILNNESDVVFQDIKAGTYAISCYHDKNSNQKLDFNSLGIPKEPTAASNNAKGFFGPPKFKDAKFQVVNKNKELIINF